MTRKPTRRASSSSAAPTRCRLWLRCAGGGCAARPSRRSCRCLGALGAAVPDQLGIEARLGDLEVLGMDLADEVEVDEAVVHRRDQRVGLEDRGAGDGSSRPGVSITSTSASGRQPAIAASSASSLWSSSTSKRAAAARCRAGAWSRRGSRDSGSWCAGGCRGRAPDAVAGGGQRDRGVDRGGRLAGAALFVGEDDEMRLAIG
jgi:hypothetical protein